jgi:predicted porin
MKKSLLALAVLGAFTGVASAQSSVTLFGIVDLSVNNIKNGTAKTTSLASNQLNSNRLGFRGTEDLGGGLGAGFWLEMGMDNATGQAGGGSGNVQNADGTSSQLFNRRSTVSLTGGFGEIRAGRDYDPTFLNWSAFDAYGANGMGEGLNLVNTLGSGVGTTVRANNSVGYFLPSNLGGLYGSAMVAAGQGLAGNKYQGARIGYAAGPIDTALAYGVTKAPVPGSAVNDFKVLNWGGSWNFGVAKLILLFNQNKFGALKQNLYEVSTSVPLGQGEFRLAYTHADSKGTGIDNNDANQIGGEYIYNLSKRTALYGQAAQIKNKGAFAASVLGGTPSAGLAGAKSTGFGVGIRHSF